MARNHIGIILVTPAKNEEKFLPEVAKSVIEQTITPKLWIIVDDNSADATSVIIKKFEMRHKWIKGIQISDVVTKDLKRYGIVCKKGFDYAIDYCEKHNISWEYIGLLDADSVIEKQFLEKLIEEFEKNQKLGIVSGGVYYEKGSELIWEKSREDLPRGTGRLWQRKCFVETGGYLPTPSPESISRVKAIHRGWEIKQIKSTKLIQLRKTASDGGLWHGYFVKGNMAYYINHHPIIVFLASVRFSTKFPYYTGMAYLYGYIISVFKKEIKIDDEEIKDYYWNERLKEYKNLFFRKLKGE